MDLTPTSQPTYLGSTSFMSAFHHDQQYLSLPTPKIVHASTLRKAWSADFTHVFPRLVQLLRPLRLYEDLVADEYHQRPFTVIPAPLVLTPLRLLRSHWDQKGWPQEGLASRITQNTATQLVKVEANMTTDQFYHLFTGVNLRWEFVGLIFALAGLGAILDRLSLDKTIRQLTPDGWGTFDGGLRPATVIRLRYMIAMLREQVMELSLGRGAVGSRQNEIQITYQECKRLWDRVPSEFHYNKHSWGVLSPHLSIISLVIHLEYLHTMLQVERIRCSESPDAITDLLDSAMQIVSAVTDFAKHRDQESSIREQYTWIVCVEVTKVMVRLLNSNRPAPNSGERAWDSSNAIGVSLNAYEQRETAQNVDALETSEDFLKWLDELGLDTSIPEILL
ncbi:hypothetical protein BBP40_007245 [Aspergillus hancockii]|nr:hypothetical protein BBP40_007245 [Aspergillus hancockii]